MNPRTAILRNSLRERVATWANRHHLAELRANVRRYLGKAPDTEEEARSAIAYALVTASVGAASFFDRFVAQAGHLPRAERMLFDEWARARFGLFRVLDVAPGEWIEVHDVLADRTFTIPEKSGSKQVGPGVWLAAFVYEVDGAWALEGTIAAVPLVARIAGVQAALRAYAELGAAPADASPAASRQVASAVFDAMNHAARPPRFVNLDGDDIELVRTTLGVAWADVVRVLADWPDADDEEEEDGGARLLAVYGPEVKRHAGGDVVRASFRGDAEIVTLSTNSLARTDAMLARWREATGAELTVLSQARTPVESNREGNALIFETTTIYGDEGGSAESAQARAYEELDAGWPDTPIPWLDGLTPRQAVAAGRRAEVLAIAESPNGDSWPSAVGLLAR